MSNQLCPPPPPLHLTHFQVLDVLSRVGLSPDAVLNFEKSLPAATSHHLVGLCCRAVDLLQRRCDLTSFVKKATLRSFAEFCKEPTEREEMLTLAGSKGKSQYDDRILKRDVGVWRLLREFKVFCVLPLLMSQSCMPPLQVLFDALAPLPQRHYSIASSPMVTLAPHI